MRRGGGGAGRACWRPRALAALLIVVPVAAACSSSSGSSGESGSTVTTSALATSTAEVTTSSTSPASTASTLPATTTAVEPATTEDAAPTTAAGEDGVSPEQAFGDAVAERLGENGETDVQLALDLYASAYGHAEELGATPLPGGGGEGTLAMQAVRDHWDELTAAQQEVIRTDFDAAAESTTVISAEDIDAAAGEPAGVAGWSRAVTIDDEIRAVAATIAGRFGPLGVDIRVSYMTLDRDPPAGLRAVYADANPVTATGDLATTLTEYATCHVRIFPAFTRLLTAAIDRTALLAHEVFHCFQYAVIASSANTDVLRYGRSRVSRSGWQRRSREAEPSSRAGGRTGSFSNEGCRRGRTTQWASSLPSTTTASIRGRCSVRC